ncbi:MAG: hypothetical protein PF630_00795 [Gammaproteobacteria bacterium]|nr:hypothetical protein [Gammaproteobacteria bacterium]
MVPADSGGSFVVCFDTAGTLQWHALVSGGGAQIQAIVRLPNNQVYAAGLFGGEASIQGPDGSHALHGMAGVDAFVVKLAADGKLLWVKVFANRLGSQAWKLAPDGNGGVIVQGTYQDSLAVEDIQLTAVGQRDLFLARMDADGHLLWLRSLGSKNNEAFGDLAVSGNIVYELLATEGSIVDLSPVDLGRGHSDVILVQRNLSDGQVNWYRRIGGRVMDFPGSLTVDDTGDVYVAVSFQDRAWIIRPEDTYTSHGSMDILVAAFDSKGGIRWTHRRGDDGVEMASTMMLNCSGKLLMLAYLRSSTISSASGTVLEQISVEDGQARDITAEVFPGQNNMQVMSLAAFGERGFAFTGTSSNTKPDDGVAIMSEISRRLGGKSDAVTGMRGSGSCLN